MRGIWNLIIGLLALSNVIYKLIRCIDCRERIFGIEMNGYLYLAIWSILGIYILYRFYLDNKKTN